MHAPCTKRNQVRGKKVIADSEKRDKKGKKEKNVESSFVMSRLSCVIKNAAVHGG